MAAARGRDEGGGGQDRDKGIAKLHRTVAKSALRILRHSEIVTFISILPLQFPSQQPLYHGVAEKSSIKENGALNDGDSHGVN